MDPHYGVGAIHRDHSHTRQCMAHCHTALSRNRSNTISRAQRESWAVVLGPFQGRAESKAGAHRRCTTTEHQHRRVSESPTKCLEPDEPECRSNCGTPWVREILYDTTPKPRTALPTGHRLLGSSLLMPRSKQSNREMAQKGDAYARSEQRDAGTHHQTVVQKPMFPSGGIHAAKQSQVFCPTNVGKAVHLVGANYEYNQPSQPASQPVDSRIICSLSEVQFPAPDYTVL